MNTPSYKSNVEHTTKEKGDSYQKLNDKVECPKALISIMIKTVPCAERHKTSAVVISWPILQGGMWK